MSNYDIQARFECQNMIVNVKIRYSVSFECLNRNLNVKIRHSAPVRVSK